MSVEREFDTCHLRNLFAGLSRDLEAGIRRLERGLRSKEALILAKELSLGLILFNPPVIGECVIEAVRIGSLNDWPEVTINVTESDIENASGVISCLKSMIGCSDDIDPREFALGINLRGHRAGLSLRDLEEASKSDAALIKLAINQSRVNQDICESLVEMLNIQIRRLAIREELAAILGKPVGDSNRTRSVSSRTVNLLPVPSAKFSVDNNRGEISYLGAILPRCRTKVFNLLVMIIGRDGKTIPHADLIHKCCNARISDCVTIGKATGTLRGLVSLANKVLASTPFEIAPDKGRGYRLSQRCNDNATLSERFQQNLVA